MAKWKKGQVWSYDLIIASMIFVVAMAILAFFWWSARTNMSENKDAIIRESLKIGDVLMSPGIPADWNTAGGFDPFDDSTWSNVQQIGLAESWTNRSLSVNKLNNLRTMSSTNYSYTRSLLRSKYNFYVEFKFRNTRNNNLEQPVLMDGLPITAGSPYNDMTVKAIARDDRVVVYNNSIIIMRLYLWSNSNAD
ncbi:hypothetical protein H0N98_01080 [Candidatus Micrarchaeota archaeon]|nr:hypothetical protein [Candidatus Micrarchaeota archaeon]